MSWRHGEAIRSLPFSGEPAMRAVLWVLAHYADARTGQCWPSVATIADDTGYSPRNVQRALRRLEANRLLSITSYRNGGRGRASVYMLTLPGCDTLDQGFAPPPPALKGDTAAPFSPPKGDTASPFEAVKGDVAAPFADQSTEKGATVSPFEGVKGDTTSSQHSKKERLKDSGRASDSHPRAGTRERVDAREVNPSVGILLPADWMPDEAALAWARKQCPLVNIERETAQFIDLSTTKGETYVHPTAAWRTFIRHGQRFAERDAKREDRGGAAAGVQSGIDRLRQAAARSRS